MIEVRVRGRDAKAAALYRYLHWFNRYHRAEIEQAQLQAMVHRILYGDGGLAGAVKRFHDEVPILRRPPHQRRP